MVYNEDKSDKNFSREDMSMNLQDNAALTEKLSTLIDDMCRAFGNIMVQLGIDTDINDAVRTEMGLFMMYLAASDGEISWDEVRMISGICKMELTPSHLGNFIREKNVYSVEFEKKVPYIYKSIVDVDNLLWKMGNEFSASEAFLATYKAIGEYLVKADGKIAESEMKDYQIYMGMLIEYRENNYEALKNAATGFTKNGQNEDSKPIEKKDGVAAPRKG